MLQLPFFTQFAIFVAYFALQEHKQRLISMNFFCLSTYLLIAKINMNGIHSRHLMERPFAKTLRLFSCCRIFRSYPHRFAFDAICKLFPQRHGGRNWGLYPFPTIISSNIGIVSNQIGQPAGKHRRSFVS